ncbi:MAG TPA: DUF4407 domain-containing protein [Solirubrobacteraceae bacterium]|jgi:hypothetical protein
MKGLFIWMSGAVPEVLEQCPTESKKFAATGGVVLVAATLATLSMGFTIHDFLHASMIIAVILGLGWGAAIMTFDRWLLMSIRRQRIWWLTIMMAIPRVVLAVIVGMVVAKPLVLRAFTHEVNRQVHIDKGQQLGQDRERLKSEFNPIEKLKAEKAEQQAALESNHTSESLAAEPRYQAIVGELHNAENLEREDQRRATCELEGKCGTSKQGAGPVFHKKKEVAESASTRVAEIRERLNAFEQERAGTEQGEVKKKHEFSSKRLKVVDAELERLEGERGKSEAKYVTESRESPGLLDRIEALDRLTAHNAGMRNLANLIWYLILAIDSLPAFVKTMMSLGEPSSYEEVLDYVEKDQRGAVADEHDANAEARKIIASASVDAAEVRREHEVKARGTLTARAVEVQKAVGEAYVEEWERAMVPLARKWAENWAKQATQTPSPGPGFGGPGRAGFSAGRPPSGNGAGTVGGFPPVGARPGYGPGGPTLGNGNSSGFSSGRSRFEQEPGVEPQEWRHLEQTLPLRWWSRLRRRTRR